MTEGPSLPPLLPPLLSGHAVEHGKSTLHRTKALVMLGELGAGDFLWSEDEQDMRFCLVLEPEVARPRCAEVLFVAMLAIGDSIGALSPPEVSVTYEWPTNILVNGGAAGYVDLHISPPKNDDSENENDAIPDWLILTVKVAIRPNDNDMEFGKNIDDTFLWAEGCGDIDRTRLLESVARHLINAIHTWESDGFKPIHEQWTGRLDERRKINEIFAVDDLTGLDENGNAIVTRDGQHNVLQTLEQLAIVRASRPGCKSLKKPSHSEAL